MPSHANILSEMQLQVQIHVTPNRSQLAGQVTVWAFHQEHKEEKGEGRHFKVSCGVFYYLGF